MTQISLDISSHAASLSQLAHNLDRSAARNQHGVTNPSKPPVKGPLSGESEMFTRINGLKSWRWLSVLCPIGILAVEYWQEQQNDSHVKVRLGFQMLPWTWISNVGVQTSWSIMIKENTFLDWQRSQCQVKSIVPRALDDSLRNGNLFDAGSILLALPVEQLKRIVDSKVVSHRFHITWDLLITFLQTLGSETPICHSYLLTMMTGGKVPAFKLVSASSKK